MPASSGQDVSDVSLMMPPIKEKSSELKYPDKVTEEAANAASDINTMCIDVGLRRNNKVRRCTFGLLCVLVELLGRWGRNYHELWPGSTRFLTKTKRPSLREGLFVRIQLMNPPVYDGQSLPTKSARMVRRLGSPISWRS